MNSNQHQAMNKVTMAGMLITLGIVFGDLGTSPLYVLRAIVGEGAIDTNVVLGGISCIFWTLTLQTTVKYVLLTLRADNNGEGGIFSLYALIRRYKIKWMIAPAIIGGSMLLADGVITPSISISSAVEGLNILDKNINTIPIVLGILTLLFVIQQFGTKFVGRFFGPIMVIWFSMLIIVGGVHLIHNLSVLKAINPYYGYSLLMNHPNGFWLLGAVFLCTTGAEALYSDLGHCGRGNIRISWIFVKISLLINYFGQGAWLISQNGHLLSGRNPFFEVIPYPGLFLIPGVLIATLASIVASQALISGAYTLINEAIRLDFWPKLRVVYPTELRGQIYIPTLNWMLYIGCVAIVFYFKESSNMEAAYGLAIVFTMMMTTILLTTYMRVKHYPKYIVYTSFFIFAAVELSFMVANLSKFTHGGWITLLIATILSSVMYIWYKGKKIRNRFLQFVRLQPYLDLLKDLEKDLSVPKYATHLVYLTRAGRHDESESKVVYSIFQKQPKRADVYWFIHVDVVDEPYRKEYKITELIPGSSFRIDFILGFREEPRINLLFRKVVENMVENKEVDITSRYESLNKKKMFGDFRFVVIEEFISYDNQLNFFDKIIINFYFLLKKISLSEAKAFGLDTSSVTVEKFPLIIAPAKSINLTRIY